MYGCVHIYTGKISLRIYVIDNTSYLLLERETDWLGVELEETFFNLYHLEAFDFLTI